MKTQKFQCKIKDRLYLSILNLGLSQVIIYLGKYPMGKDNFLPGYDFGLPR